MSIANILLQGFGQGAQTLGSSMFQEQEQRRREAARMGELEQQERARRALVEESARVQEQQRVRENEELTAALRSMGVIGEGQTATRTTAPFYQSEMANKRAAAQAEAADKRNRDTIEGRLTGQQAQIDAMRGVNDARAAALQAQAAAAQALAASRSGAGQSARPRDPLPLTAQRELGELTDVYALIRDARTGMDTPEAKGATGLKYNIANVLTPASMESRVQSMLDGGKGDVVRARLGNLWSTIGKLRSGGAITDAEFKRLEPFLPSANDDYQKAVTKLDELERSYRDVIERRAATWGMGYEVPDLSGILAPQRPASAASGGGRGYSPNNPFAGGRP